MCVPLSAPGGLTLQFCPSLQCTLLEAHSRKLPRARLAFAAALTWRLKLEDGSFHERAAQSKESTTTRRPELRTLPSRSRGAICMLSR